VNNEKAAVKFINLNNSIIKLKLNL